MFPLLTFRASTATPKRLQQEQASMQAISSCFASIHPHLFIERLVGKDKVHMDLLLFGQSKIPKIVLTKGQPISMRIVPNVLDFSAILRAHQHVDSLCHLCAL